MVSFIGVDISSHLQGFFLIVDVRHPDWRHQRKKMGQKGFSRESKCYHLRTRFVFFGNYIVIGFQCCRLQHQHNPGRVTSSSSPCFISTLHFHKFRWQWEHPTSAASGTIHRLSVCTGIIGNEVHKEDLFDATDSRTWSAKHFYGSYCISKGKKSKLGSEALEQEAEIQTNCKVSTRFVVILHCDKSQPMSGPCMSVQEDTAKSQS